MKKKKKKQKPEVYKQKKKLKVGSFLEIKKEGDRVCWVECLCNNTQLIPDMITLSSFNIYKTTTKKYISKVHVSRRYNINDDSYNSTDSNMNLKTNYHKFYSNKSTNLKRNLSCFKSNTKKRKKIRQNIKHIKWYPSHLYRLELREAPDSEQRRRRRGESAACRPSPFPFSSAVSSPIRYLTAAVYWQSAFIMPL